MATDIWKAGKTHFMIEMGKGKKYRKRKSIYQSKVTVITKDGQKITMSAEQYKRKKK